MSHANLNPLEADPANFLQRFVTMDLTGFPHFTPEAKQQSKQWKHPDSPSSNSIRKGSGNEQCPCSVHAVEDFLNGLEKDLFEMALRILNIAGESV